MSLKNDSDYEDLDAMVDPLPLDGDMTLGPSVHPVDDADMLSQISGITDPNVLDAIMKDLINTDSDKTVLTDASLLDHLSVTEDDGQRISECLITMFPPDDDPKWLNFDTYGINPKSYKKWVSTFEKSPTTGKLHVHVAAKFNNALRPRFHLLRKRIGEVIGENPNIRCAKRPSIENYQRIVNYILKPSTKIQGMVPYHHPGSENLVFDGALYAKITGQPDKTLSKADQKTLEAIQFIESFPISTPWNSIVHASAESKLLLATNSWGKKFHEGREASVPDREINMVVVMYGYSGTGKTTMALSWGKRDGVPDEERYYIRNCDEAFFGSGQHSVKKYHEHLIYEEFAGQESYSLWKQVCNPGHQGPKVPIKGSTAQLNHNTVIMCSNDHMASWYRKLWRKDPKQWTPLLRRLGKVLFFPEFKPDGSPNAPGIGGQTEPYWIDQTAAFKECTTYEMACEHAAKWWPLKAIDDDEGDRSAAFAPLDVPITDYSSREYLQYDRTGIPPKSCLRTKSFTLGGKRKR